MKTIIFCLITGSLLFAVPSYEDTYVKPVEALVVVKTPPKKVVKVKTVKYAPPTGKALEWATYVSQETNVPVDTISRIMWAESRYNSQAKHINRNNSYDTGLFQINSQHITLAQKMGMDIFTDEGNVHFAIYLMKKNGLRDWGASQHNWNVI